MNEAQLTKKQKELTNLSEKIRAKGYSLETERAYCGAVGKFIDFLCWVSWPVSATAEDGAQLRDLQVVLGHRSIETTARYVRPDPERVPSPLERMRIVA